MYVMDTLTGSPCYFCGEPLASGEWHLVELPSPVDTPWVTICRECWLVVSDVD